MSESLEGDRILEEESLLADIRGELNLLNLNIKKDCFTAEQSLKNKIKSLGFYDGDENGENIRFNIVNVKKYLEGIKNKTWTDLDVKSSKLEKGVRTIAIQIAINYINMKNGDSSNQIDLIDGIRGNKTWKCVREFQVANNLKNTDGLPGHETITKILELLGSSIGGDIIQGDEKLDLQGNKEGTGDNIDKDKCVTILRDMEIYGKDNEGYGTLGDNLKDKLNTIGNRGKLEGIIFKNSQFQHLLSSIMSHQGQRIEFIKQRYNQNRIIENNNELQEKTDEDLSKEIKAVQTWEDYKYQHFSKENFEEYILSNEGIEIIIDEIISHIDTSHTDENGEYDRFYEGYPFSMTNLEIRLRNAWEDKIKYDYNNEIQDYEGDKQNVISNQIIGYVDEIVGNCMKSNNYDFYKDIILELNGLLSKGVDDVPINEIFSNKDQKDSFKEVLGSKIKMYEIFVRNKDNFNLDAGDKQVNLQLKCYLYIYGYIFYSGDSDDSFKLNGNIAYYEDILPDVMITILSNDDASLINSIRHKAFLEREKKLEQERKERDEQRRIELAKRNREKNEQFQSTQITDKHGNISEIQTDHLDPNTATGPEIAAEADLGTKLNDYNLNIEEFEEENKPRIEESAFLDAWKEFIKSHDNIKDFITQEGMRNLFDISSNTIKASEWMNFKETNPLLKDMPQDKTEEIYSIISSFSSYFTDAKDKLSNNSSEMKVKVNKTVRTYAIGAVIDNVRDTFDVISEGLNGDFKGFQLNKENPVKKDGDNIIISGSFNGSDVKVRYNLETGELFMNTFLHRLNPNKIIIGESSSIDYPIGRIEAFNDVLNDYYRLPSHTHRSHDVNNGPLSNGDNHTQKPKDSHSREERAKSLLNSQIALIGEAIKDNTESQAQKNSAIIKFMKTFNIMSDSGEFKSLDFNRGSNLFDIIEIIDNTGNIQNGDIESLEYFNNIFMPTIMEYSGLKRGERNEYQDKENKKSKRIFNYEGDSESIKALRNNAKSFHPTQFLGIANFEGQHQLGFANFIKEIFVTGYEPNGKLDKVKMERFINDLEMENRKNNDIDSLLELQLNNV